MTQSANQARNAELASFRGRAAFATKTVHDKQAEEKEEPDGQADQWESYNEIAELRIEAVANGSGQHDPKKTHYREPDSDRNHGCKNAFCSGRFRGFFVGHTL